MTQPALIVHGGAGNIPPADHDAYLRGCTRAAEVAWKLLDGGASALHAVEAAVRILEDDPTYDSGYGSVLNQRGEVELDAILMDGRTLDLGAVICVQNIANPITLARLVMTETPHKVLAGEGARLFALSQQLPLTPMDDLISAKARERFNRKVRGEQDEEDIAYDAYEPQGTCGAVAVDRAGNLAAATSTGGTNYKMVGRVGDSPLVGAGAYADNLSGAASATGTGEDIMRVCLSKTATDALLRGLNAQQAADYAISYMAQRINGEGGLIMVDKDGGVGFAHNTPCISVAWAEAQPDGSTLIRAAIRR